MCLAPKGVSFLTIGFLLSFLSGGDSVRCYFGLSGEDYSVKPSVAFGSSTLGFSKTSATCATTGDGFLLVVTISTEVVRKLSIYAIVGAKFIES